MTQKKLTYGFLLILLFFLGCAYYNTFFNAQRNYEQALKKQKNSKSTQRISPDIKKNYQKAIEKSWKLIKVYGDSNKYADDALLLIGKAYYQIHEYEKAERALSQFLLKYFKSDRIPEVKLWLARTYIALDKKDKALEILNQLLAQKIPKRLAGEAFYILGELYFEQNDYEQAISKLSRAAEITDDDEIKGNALFMMGDAYYQLDEYENAIDCYDKLTKLDIPAVREYEATAKKVESLIELKRYEEAEKILRKMLSSPRFKEQFSLIETRLANLYEIQGQTDLARDYYYEIAKKYKRSEGAILSYYYLGQLYEYEYANFDSAKFYYQKVKNLKSNQEILDDARAKVKLLAEYLKIRDQIRRDYADLLKLERGDSLLTDSVEVEADTLKKVKKKENKEDLFGQKTDLTEEKGQNRQSQTPLSKEDSLKLAKQKKKRKKPKKVLVSRTPQEVRSSFKRNHFAKAEYFLLKYQNFDSAEVAYKTFIKMFDDSVLTPKSYYALYFIYHDLKHDSLKADSLRRIIVTRFPDTIYGKKLQGKQETVINEQQTSPFVGMYRQAEDFMDQGRYREAVELFTTIAAKDSGSIWAQKARYAIAYIYEKYLNDVQKAIDAYAQIIKEYPQSRFAMIAKKKIAPPPEEKKPEKKEEAPKEEGPEQEKTEKRPPAEKKKPAIIKPMREKDAH